MNWYRIFYVFIFYLKRGRPTGILQSQFVKTLNLINKTVVGTTDIVVITAASMDASSNDQ